MASSPFDTSPTGFPYSMPYRPNMISELPGSSAMYNNDNNSNTPLSPRPSQAQVATPTSPTPKRQEAYIAIGIDFGTTYSGVSWAYSDDPDVINEVTHWPCHERRGKDEVQIPTQIDLETRKWGYQVPPNVDAVRWFKLLLLGPDDAPDDVKNSEQLRDARTRLQRQAYLPSSDSSSPPNPEMVVNLIAEFLGHMWTHALKEIGREIDVDVLPLKVALTVPAIWPAYARQRMKEAARRAGILSHRTIGKTTLMLVEEPEAAALCTLFDRRNYPEISVGETFIVCDCGGGTVDIISYTVESREPFRIAEAVRGAGKLCGAFLVDQAFENYMTAKSGLKFGKCEANDFRSFVNDEWEYSMKRNFDGEEQQSSFVIRPPARTFGTMKRVRGVNDNFRLTKDVIKQFYSKTYTGIRELISQQSEQIMVTRRKAPKKVLLVGGLGASPYLHSILNEQYQNVLQPRKAWSAVARGAVIKVLKSAFDPEASDPGTIATLRAYPSIASRVARFSYGVQLYEPVETVWPPADREKDRFYTNPSGVECVYRMIWYLRQNERVDNKEPIVYEYHKHLLNRHEMSTTMQICTSDAGTPPIRWDASVKKLCVIRYEIGVPWEQMKPVKDSEGRVYRLADGMKLSMSFDGEPKWALDSGGKVVEQDVNVQYVGA